MFIKLASEFSGRIISSAAGLRLTQPVDAASASAHGARTTSTSCFSATRGNQREGHLVGQRRRFRATDVYGLEGHRAAPLSRATARGQLGVANG
jgi:hypothetical protein